MAPKAAVSQHLAGGHQSAIWRDARYCAYRRTLVTTLYSNFGAASYCSLGFSALDLLAIGVDSEGQGRATRYRRFPTTRSPTTAAGVVHCRRCVVFETPLLRFGGFAPASGRKRRQSPAASVRARSRFHIASGLPSLHSATAS